MWEAHQLNIYIFAPEINAHHCTGLHYNTEGVTKWATTDKLFYFLINKNSSYLSSYNSSYKQWFSDI